MGLIQIENMEFYAFHGHYREEQIVGNKFLVELSIDSDMSNFCRLTEKAVNAYESFCSGKGTGMELLFSSGGILLWNNYFSNDNPGYRVYNDLISEVLVEEILVNNGDTKYNTGTVVSTIHRTITNGLSY